MTTAIAFASMIGALLGMSGTALILFAAVLIASIGCELEGSSDGYTRKPAPIHEFGFVSALRTDFVLGSVLRAII